MSSLNGSRVKVMRLHAPYHIVDVGQIGPGAVSDSDIKRTPLKLTYFDGGVLISGKGAKGTFKSYIPSANIVGIDLEPEDVG